MVELDAFHPSVFTIPTFGGSTFYPTYDGNGNIMGYVDLDSGVSVAEFEYGPFGETLRATRSLEDQRSLVEAVGFTAGAIQSYAGTEDKTGTVTVSADGTQLTLDGNLWKSLPMNGQLTETTVLRFSFRSDTAAEWCGVGFDNDGTIQTGPGSHYYKISGYDDYSVYGYNESYAGYTEYIVGSGWKQVEIPIGQTANLISYDRMVFICDQDGTSQGNFQIKDLQIINTSKVSELNPSSLSFRFSTKYQDAETGLLYYGYRYYDAETGRWLSKDPLGETGGLNLYAMVINDPINLVDLYGLTPCSVNLYFGHGQLPGDPQDPRHKSQTDQLKTDLDRIEANNRRYQERLEQYRLRTKDLSDSNNIGAGSPPVNENCGTYYGYGGCQAEFANGQIPPEMRAVDPSVFDDLENKDGDIPFHADLAKEAIERLWRQGISTALNECGKSKSGGCCDTVSVSLECDSRPVFLQGFGLKPGSSMSSLSPFCGRTIELNCESKEWKWK